MPNRTHYITGVVAAVMIVVLCGCASHRAPKGWLVGVSETQQSACGAWIEVQYTDGDKDEIDQGELLAVHDDSLFLMGQLGFEGLKRKDINDIKLVKYRSEHGKNTAWTVVGALSTISHGFILIISAPAWIIFGSTATSVISREPQESYSSDDAYETRKNENWRIMATYARFPQGLPPGLDRSLLEERPGVQSNM